MNAKMWMSTQLIEEKITGVRERERREKKEKDESIGLAVPCSCAHISRFHVQREANGSDSRYRTCPPADV